MASANALLLTKRLADAYFGSGSFKLLPTSSAPSETDLDTLSHRSDVTNEITGTGYTAGGFAVTVTVGSVDTVNNRTPVTLTNLAPALTAATINAAGAWLYKVVGSAATDELCCWIDTGAIAAAAQNVNITFTAPLYVNR